MQQSSKGQARIKRQIDRENEHISRILEKNDTEEQAKKKVKPDAEASIQGGATEADQPMEIVPAVRSQSRASSSWERPDDTDPKRQKIEPSVEEEPMETNMVERMFQDDMRWNLDTIEDMCEKENPDLLRRAADYAYFDENTWEEIDPK